MQTELLVLIDDGPYIKNSDQLGLRSIGSRAKYRVLRIPIPDPEGLIESRSATLIDTKFTPFKSRDTAPIITKSLTLYLEIFR